MVESDNHICWKLFDLLHAFNFPCEAWTVAKRGLNQLFDDARGRLMVFDNVFLKQRFLISRCFLTMGFYGV